MVRIHSNQQQANALATASPHFFHSPPPLPSDSFDDLSLVFDLAPVGLCITRNRILDRYNVAWSSMFGYNIEDLRGCSTAVLYPSQEEYEAIAIRSRPVFESAGFYQDDRIMKHRTDGLFWVHAIGRALDPVDPFSCVVWIFEDLSERRRVTPGLTRRERQIAQELLKGQTSKQIARALQISPRTVEAHRARLMQKMNATSASDMLTKLFGVTAAA